MLRGGEPFFFGGMIPGEFDPVLGDSPSFICVWRVLTRVNGYFSKSHEVVREMYQRPQESQRRAAGDVYDQDTLYAYRTLEE